MCLQFNYGTNGSVENQSTIGKFVLDITNHSNRAKDEKQLRVGVSNKTMR